MTITLYVVIGMVSFFVGYIAGSGRGYRDGLEDAAEVISEAIVIKVMKQSERERD